MSTWQVIFPWLPPMLILAVLSALFSGSEAALFSLRDKDLRNLSRRGTSGRLAVNLVSQPERLLSAILFWNLLINITFFGIAGIVAGKLENTDPGGARVAIAFTIVSLFFVIFFSEMLPKCVGVLSPRRIALFSSLPMTIAVRTISPVLPLISAVNLGVQRLLWPSFTPEPEIELEDIGRAIELGTHDAALAKQEQAALHNLVHLADIRVDECMRPRSGLQMLRPPILAEQFRGPPPPGGYAIVLEGDNDEIVGAIAINSMRPSQFDDLASGMEPVCYIPWSANVSSVLDLLQRQRLNVAAVVNEFGESIGVLSVQDIIRQVLTGHFEHVNVESQQPLETIGEGHYRASGAMGVRKLAKLLDARPPEGRNATIEGIMQRINNKPPRAGDRCEWEDYILEVIEQDEAGNCVIDIRHVDEIQPDPETNSMQSANDSSEESP